LITRSIDQSSTSTSTSLQKNKSTSNQAQTPPRPPPQQDPNELPWVRREREEAARASGEGPNGPPFAVFLVASALVAIAAVGSVFEFVNKNAIFGVLPPSSPLYTPILALFALTGLPSAGWLFFKAVTTANEEAERQDKVSRVFFNNTFDSFSEERFFPCVVFLSLTPLFLFSEKTPKTQYRSTASSESFSVFVLFEKK